MTYPSLPKEVNLNQILRLGGADASSVVNSFLLPHHEHLLPPTPTPQKKYDLEERWSKRMASPKKFRRSTA
jgi:hypothetical protein